MRGRSTLPPGPKNWKATGVIVGPSRGALPVTHYEVLGVHRKSTHAEIHDAWRALASELHPDKDPSNHDAAVRVNQAYAQLKTPAGMKFYNDLIAVVGTKCEACRSTGVKTRQKGVLKFHSACPTCHGSGYV